MDEQQDLDRSSGPAFERTGVEKVDQVLEEINRLEGLPVSEHVGAFERAQEQLRRALDAPQET